MKQLKILLYADSFKGNIFQKESYVQFFSQFGEVVLITSHNDFNFWMEHADVLALPGGADVDPKRYGEKPHFLVRNINAQYEYLDLNLATEWVKTGKPIVGICRGLQTLNVILGGTLWQDIWSHVSYGERSEHMHQLYTHIEGFNKFGVNSFHHQAIRKLAPELECIGWSLFSKYDPMVKKNRFLEHIYTTNKKSGDLVKTTQRYHVIAEVVKHRTKPYVAFQYHPEDTYCEFAISAINECLLEAYPERYQDTYNSFEIVPPPEAKELPMYNYNEI